MSYRQRFSVSRCLLVGVVCVAGAMFKKPKIPAQDRCPRSTPSKTRGPPPAKNEALLRDTIAELASGPQPVPVDHHAPILEYAAYNPEHVDAWEAAGELAFRVRTISANLTSAAESQKKHPSATFGMTSQAGMTKEEYRARNLEKPVVGDLSALQSEGSFRGLNVAQAQALPAAFSWVENGAVGPVRNQGQCGSCYSFAATAAIAGAYFVKTGELVPLSQQELVACASKSGCSGGAALAVYWEMSGTGIDGHTYDTNPLSFSAANHSQLTPWGLVSYDAYPYEFAHFEGKYNPRPCGPNNPHKPPNCIGQCRFRDSDLQNRQYALDNPQNPEIKEVDTDAFSLVFVKGGVMVPGDEEAIAAALMQYGPLSISIDANDDLQNYTGGILNLSSTDCPGERFAQVDGLNHGVTLVGFGVGADIKNGDSKWSWDSAEGQALAGFGVGTGKCTQYWTIQNSWGKNWGEDANGVPYSQSPSKGGYFRYARGTGIPNGVCGMYKQVTRPIV